jgi:hypothetical protein
MDDPVRDRPGQRGRVVVLPTVRHNSPRRSYKGVVSGGRIPTAIVDHQTMPTVLGLEQDDPASRARCLAPAYGYRV